MQGPPLRGPITQDIRTDRLSIILVGARGTGKSTLATIAWSSFGFKYIDLGYLALRREGNTQPGSGKEPSTLKDLLNLHSRGCAIVWPSGNVEDAGLRLLRDYSQSHHVIHVTRSVSAIAEYLHSPDPIKVERMLALENRIYRACSNFEFYNFDEDAGATVATRHESVATEKLGTPRNSLRLKRLEESFVRFIRNISHFSAITQRRDQLSLPISRSDYTYLLSIPLSLVNLPEFQLSWLDCGADACQVEIDISKELARRSAASLLDDISRVCATLTRFFEGPIVYHVLLPATGGFNLESVYFDLMRHAFRINVDYVTVDLRWPSDRILSLTNQKGSTKLVGVFHDEDPGFDGWAQRKRWDMYRKACTLDLDGVRITQVCKSMEDNHALTAFTVAVNRQSLKRPFLSAYNTGPLGRSSRCSNQIFTPITTSELVVGDSQTLTVPNYETELDIRLAQNALYASFMYDPMRYHIIGIDVSYTLSPLIHSAAYRFFGMPHSFTHHSMSTLDEMQLLGKDVHLGGISIAQGFKRSVFPFVTAMSHHASAIGAINTLIPMRCPFKNLDQPPPDFWSGRNRAGLVLGLYGENTDWSGMARCVSRNLSPANAITSRTTALVIGAGGMARAAIYALLQIGVLRVVIYNRTTSHAKALANYFNNLQVIKKRNGLSTPVYQENMVNDQAEVRLIDTLEQEWCEGLAQPTIVISCVPASSAVNQSGAQITLPLQWMQSPTGGVVLDLGYHPLITPLLRQVRQHAHRGWVTVDGLDNLAAQASIQFELFTGRKVPQNYMKIEALKGYQILHSSDAEAQEVVQDKLALLGEAS